MDHATDLKNKLQQWTNAHADEILQATQSVLRIPSVTDPASVERSAPFGKPIADALNFTLDLCARLGFATENFDGYAGHATFGDDGGDGAEIAAMLGHLDVVPPGDHWTHEPWGGEIRDGFLWGRGASDDKGPTFAALFGAAAVVDLVRKGELDPPARRLRLIFGCDEESGWQCMTHYFGAAGQPQPTLAFTPDASFPLVHAEKGAFTAIVRRAVSGEESGVSVSHFQSGLRPNMVPDFATAQLADGRTLTAQGKGAHGSTPEAGVNAAVLLLNDLSTLPDLHPEEEVWIRDLIGRAAGDGAGVGIAGADEITGPLTCNLGVVTKENNVVTATFNVRYPATWDASVLTRFRAMLTDGGWEVVEIAHTPPLYVPVDAEPVRTLLGVYQEHTGDLSAPHTMGGRTYATVVAPHGVAFGAAMAGDPDVAHQADERFATARLLQCVAIYGHALYALANVSRANTLRANT